MPLFCQRSTIIAVFVAIWTSPMLPFFLMVRWPPVHEDMGSSDKELWTAYEHGRNSLPGRDFDETAQFYSSV